MKLVKDTEGKILDANTVSDKEAEEAFKTILTCLFIHISEPTRPY